MADSKAEVVPYQGWNSTTSPLGHTKHPEDLLHTHIRTVNIYTKILVELRLKNAQTIFIQTHIRDSTTKYPI